MAQQTAEHCINPSEGSSNSDNSGSIFLVSGDNLSSSIALFELIVAIGAARLMAPAHSHNQYQETICEKYIQNRRKH
jgi:hypothetical protein